MKRFLMAGAMAMAVALTGAGAANALMTAPVTPGIPATQTVSFSVYLPLRNTDTMKAVAAALQTKGSPTYHQWLTPAQVSAQFGPTAAAIAQVKSVLTAAGFTVTGSDVLSVKATGPASAVTKTFQTGLKAVAASNGGTRVVSTSRLIMPASLASLGAVVPNFANVPEHHVAGVNLGAAPENRNGPYGGYNYNDLKQAYDYPAYSSLDGTGANVGIVMESAPQESDVAAMFNHEGFTATTGKSPPTYTYVPIDGGGSYGGLNDGGTDEAELDVQMVLGGAPGANVTFLSVPNLGDGFILDAYDYVINNPGQFDVVTSSFGECELFYTPAYNNGYDNTPVLGLYDEIFFIGSELEGVTWLASSGDQGGPGCPSSNIIPYFAGLNGGQVNFIRGVGTPAADPYVVAVGGGNLMTTTGPGLTSTYISEQGYGDPEIPYDEFGVGAVMAGGYWGADGGVSQIFSQPSYQTLVNVHSTAGRTVPDIGMLVGGCPGGISEPNCPYLSRSSVIVTIGATNSTGAGSRYGFIGTSVSSPELAGALALVVQAYGGKLGDIHPYLYQQSAAQLATPALGYYHNANPGTDGIYPNAATPGYNYIYGNGSPDVRKLFGLDLLGIPSAGTPRTATNP